MCHTDKQMSNEENFQYDLDGMFDIAHQNAEKMMYIPGDKAFLADQRHGCKGDMTSEDPDWIRRSNARKERDKALTRMRRDAGLRQQAMTKECLAVLKSQCITASEDEWPIKRRKSRSCKGQNSICYPKM